MRRPPLVLINTRNRRDEVRRAIQSVFAQTVAADLLVIDDASTDGTSDMVRSEFPRATLITNPASVGVLEARNLGARIATQLAAESDGQFGEPHRRT